MFKHNNNHVFFTDMVIITKFHTKIYFNFLYQKIIVLKIITKFTFNNLYTKHITYMQYNYSIFKVILNHRIRA